MNFAQVKQANGGNITIIATFNEIGGVSLTQNQKQVCKCQLTDDNGEKHLVRLYGTMPGPTLLNMRQQFSLASYQGTNQRGQPYTGFSGFWNERAMVNQVPQNAPQAPHTIPQAPQYRSQQPNIPRPAPQGMNMPDTYAYPVTPETARRMARTAFMAAMLQNGQTPLYSYVTELVEYSYTGIEPSKAPDPDPSIQETQYQPNPGYVGDGQEGICPHCQKPLEDCTCDIPF